MSNFRRHLAWLSAHHHMSSGAARSLRSNASAQDSSILADQKRKSADGAAINAAHYHEIHEALVSYERARKVLDRERRDAIDSALDTYRRENAALVRFVDAIDRALGFTGDRE